MPATKLGIKLEQCVLFFCFLIYLFIYFGVLLTVMMFFLCLQEIKKAILSDMTKLGKEAGLKSFEQVITAFLTI